MLAPNRVSYPVLRRYRYVAAFALAALPAAASGAVLTYEMTVAPNAESSPMIKVEDGFGDTVAGDFGPPLNAGLQGNGTARFVDSGSNGNDGFGQNQLGSTFTVDMRVKGNQTVVGSSPKSMGITNGQLDPADGNTPRQRGIRIEPAGLTLVSGTGPVAGGTATVDLSNYHMIRIVVSTTAPPAGTVTIYDLENDLDGGAGFNWSVLAGPIALGGSGAAFGVGTVPETNGAIHLNPFANSSTSRSDFTLDFLRVDTGVDRGATQGIIPGPAVPCSAGVNPTTTQSRLGFENGIAPAPAAVPYTFNNLSPTDSIIGYSVTEITGLGALNDYSWISLVGANGNINPASSAAVTANLNTTALAAGSYTGYLKFDDACGPSAPCFAVDFNNPPYTGTGSALVGQDSWTGTADATAIKIDAANGVGGTGNVHVTSGSGGVDANKTSTCSADGDGVISIKFKARGSATGDGSNFWVLWVHDNAGNIIGRWIGGNNRVSGQNANGVAVGDVTLNTSTYTELEMRYYSASHQIQLFHGGSNTPDTITVGGSGNVLNSFSTLSNGTVGRIRIERINRVLAGDDVMLDDLSVTVLERHFRRIDLTVKGCEVEVQEPRTLTIGPCGLSTDNHITTHTFTIKNTGAYDWMGFQAFEFGDDDDWLTVSYTSAPVVRGATATVTATIDWSAVPITIGGDDQVGVIRFGATCDGTNYLFDTPANTITVLDNSSSGPQIVRYDGNVPPLDPDSAGTGLSFTLVNEVGNIDQGTVVSDVGLNGALDGMAYRIVDAPGAKTKWRVTPSANITNAAGATVVARVKTVSASGAVGANVSLYADPISAGAHWAGPGGLVIETDRGASAAVAGDDNYHIVRLTSRDEGGTRGTVVRVYVDENPVPKIEILNAAASNSGVVDSIGFGTTSTDGQQDIYFDCVYGSNAGAFAPGEEEDCLGTSLVCVSNCNHPFADADPAPAGDGDVDSNDFAFLQRCYTGPGPVPTLSPECKCFDRDSNGAGDGDIDVADFLRFQDCQTRDKLPWAPSVLCP